MADTKLYSNSYIDPSDGQQRFFKDLDATHSEDAADPSTILGAIKAKADNTSTDLFNLCLKRFFADNAAAFHHNSWMVNTFLVMVRNPNNNLFSVHIVSTSFWQTGPRTVYFHNLYGGYLSVYIGEGFVYFRADGMQISILTFGSQPGGYFIQYEGAFEGLNPISPV